VRAQDVHPFLRDEAAVLAERLAVDAPCLGICLGAQLLATAAGAQVTVGKNGFEVGRPPGCGGRRRASKTRPSRAPRPRACSPTGTKTPSAPRRAPRLLASTERYTQQAFRLGRSYGFQFHPEADGEAPGRVDRLERRGASALRLRPAALRAQLPKLAAAEAANAAFLERVAFQLAQSLRGGA